MVMMLAFALFALAGILLAFKRRCGIELSPAGDRRGSRAVRDAGGERAAYPQAGRMTLIPKIYRTAFG